MRLTGGGAVLVRCCSCRLYSHKELIHLFLSADEISVLVDLVLNRLVVEGDWLKFFLILSRTFVGASSMMSKPVGNVNVKFPFKYRHS